MATIVCFSGSSRAASDNQKTVLAIAGYLDQAGASVDVISLADYPAPIYNGDLEQAEGLPQGIASLKERLGNADAMVIGCPEYNGFMTPLLMNTIDWCTRSAEASVDLSCFRDKAALIVSASPGGFGGMRAATHLKTMLSGIGTLVFPDSFSVAASYQAFGDDGKLTDEGLSKRAEQVATRYVEFVNKVATP